MPNSRSAKKRLRQNVERRTRNRSRRARMSTAVRGLETALQSGDLEAAPEQLKQALSLVDKGVRQHLMHANAAARRKSRLMKRYNAALAQQQASAD